MDKDHELRKCLWRGREEGAVEAGAAGAGAAGGRCGHRERTFIARAPKSRAPAVSETSSAEGEAQTMREVRQLPPRASESMWVSLESR